MEIRKASPCAAGLLLVMMAVLAGGAALRESITIDEIAHIGAGVSYLQKLDLRMNVEHPPLPKVLAGVPLVLRGTHADYKSISWSFSRGLFNAYLGQWVFGHWLVTRWNGPVSTVMWARLPMLLLALALGWILYRCGSRLGNAQGGLLSVCAYATMPAFLAFGPLVLTDTAVTFFSLLTLWTFADMWKSSGQPSVRRFGLMLAGSLLSKFSAGLLLFAFLAFALSLRWFPTPHQPAGQAEFRLWWRRGWGNTAKGVLWAAAVVYAVYFLLSWNQPTDALEILGRNPLALVVRRLLMPLWLYLCGVVLFALGASRPTFILGHAYAHGVWFYFPVLFVLKSPVAFLGLLAAGLTAGLAAKRRLGRLPPGNPLPPHGETLGLIPNDMALHWRTMWVSLLVLVAASMLGRLDISIRHFMTPLILLILLLSPLPRVLESLGTRAGQWLTFALAVGCVVTAIRAYPLYFPFLNSLGMGRPAYTLVNDSNVDWNHALPEVQHFVENRGMAQILVDEWGFTDPGVYIPKARFWNCQEPRAEDGGQWAAVSGNMLEDGHNCVWLLRYPHQELDGGSMYAFHLPAVIPSAGSPGGPPLPSEFRNFGGVPGPDLRLYFLECIRDPQRLPETLKRMEDLFRSATTKTKPGV